jgi:SAM-dependent methyltransferase
MTIPPINRMDDLLRLQLEIEDIREDLRLLDVDFSSRKIGDFGCGDGFTTVSLATLLHPKLAIGVDKNADEINQAKALLEKIGRFRDDVATHQDDYLMAVINSLANENPIIEFRTGNIVSDENLPTGLHLAYCKKVLVNIFRGAYNNAEDGWEGVCAAAKNIAYTVSPSGFIILIEHADEYIDIKSCFEEVGLVLKTKSRIQRYDIGLQGRIENTLGVKSQYIGYVFEKPLTT